MSAGDFAHAFRAHVVPRIEPFLASGALLIAGGYSLADQADLIMRFANRMGAAHLPDPIYRDLEDWVYSELIVRASAYLDAAHA